MESKTLKNLSVKKAANLDTTPAEHGLFLFTDISKDATAKGKSKSKVNKVPKIGCSAIGLPQTLGPIVGGGGDGGTAWNFLLIRTEECKESFSSPVKKRTSEKSIGKKL
uniref:Uncharacterized protein n=1 Tax=Romanomermis culicivorax TaxID=13658 RepID=A0A915LAH1_ROMCU